MFVHRRDVQIQWGDCDPANIVYYPRYFEMFDDFDLDPVRGRRLLQAGHRPEIRPGRHPDGGYTGEIPYRLYPWRLDHH